MRRPLILLYLFIILLAFGVWNSAQAQFIKPTGIEITSPVPGEALQGVVAITGSTFADGFQSWELAFRYNDDETNTWFTLTEQTSTIKNDVLAEWDTSIITDGVYDLRLSVHLKDDQTAVAIVEGVRIRNYTPIETNTPVPTSTPFPTQADLPLPFTATPTPTETPIPPTFTPLPTNPAEISNQDLSTSLTRGVIIAAVSFLLMGLYISIRKTIQ